MRVSLCTITFRHHLVSLGEIAAWAQSNDFQGIELWGAHARNLAQQPDRNAEWLDTYGLSVPMISDYLPIDADSERPNVASQTGRSDSLLETVRALNTLRLAHPALQADGGIEFLYAEDHAYPLVYARSSEAGEAERDATDGERSGTAHETSCETPCETCSKINREAGGERIVERRSGAASHTPKFAGF